MSLNVWLAVKGIAQPTEAKIFIREDGRIKQITRQQWDILFPNREPVVIPEISTTKWVFSYNITHNLGEMADAVGIYECLWRPEEINAICAKDITDQLKTGLHKLLSDPTKYKKLNPSNGWGTYEGLVDFVTTYIEACEQYPDALIEVSR